MMMLKPDAIVINHRDNVAVALRDLSKGEIVHLPDGRDLVVRDEIPHSHKIALEDLSPGDEIVKYGEIIGQAKEHIGRGGWVHTHNLVDME